jgi:hypothetical protein
MFESELSFYRSAHSLHMSSLSSWLDQCETLMEQAIPKQTGYRAACQQLIPALQQWLEQPSTSNLAPLTSQLSTFEATIRKLEDDRKSGTSDDNNGASGGTISVEQFRKRFTMIQAQYEDRLQNITAKLAALAPTTTSATDIVDDEALADEGNDNNDQMVSPTSLRRGGRSRTSRTDTTDDDSKRTLATASSSSSATRRRAASSNSRVPDSLAGRPSWHTGDASTTDNGDRSSWLNSATSTSAAQAPPPPPSSSHGRRTSRDPRRDSDTAKLRDAERNAVSTTSVVTQTTTTRRSSSVAPR